MPNELEPLDVIRIQDVLIKPPGPKMVVCVWPRAGLFYRFNSYDEYPIGILVTQKPNHPLLEWDSYLEIGRAPIQLDEHNVQKAIHACGGAPLGKLHYSYVPAICKAIEDRDTLSARLLKAIVATLNSAIPKSALHSSALPIQVSPTSNET